MKNSKFKFLFILLFISLNSFSQKNWDTKEKTYTGGVALHGLIDVVENKVVVLEPMGKNVTINYDPFFNKYIINWDEENSSAKMELKFSEENSGGKMYVDIYSSNTAYFVHNKIDKNNQLILMSVDSSLVENKKVKLIFIFEDLK